MDALRAAVAAGADAVYLSGKQFGARKFAANFDDEELKEAVAYCHRHMVSVHVTVNILIYDSELRDAAEYLIWLYETGVDAVLIQDAGLLEIARTVVPELPVHASTQMTIHNTGGLRWAAAHGISRVVLARELSLSDVRAISAEARRLGLEIEIFLHGALCYSYSGQCLFSSIAGGRSGNRGMCAQPCRKPYTLLEESGAACGTAGYLLSPHDLALYPHLPELMDAGIDSLKIEGRMKSPEYVATVVSIYRQALDALRDRQWEPSLEDEHALLLAFNRGFTGGYLMGERGGQVMGHERPDNRGVMIGRVSSYNESRQEATISLEGSLIPEPGDGLVVRSYGRQREDVGALIRPPFSIEKESLRVRTAGPVEAGASVFLTSRASLHARAEEIMAGRGPVRNRRIPVDLEVSWQERVPVLIGSLRGPHGLLSVEMHGEGWEPARSRPLTDSKIEELLRRCGESDFIFRDLEMHYPGGLFVPISMLTGLRRDFLERVAEALEAAYRPPEDRSAEARARLEALPWDAPSRMPETQLPVLVAYADSPATVKGAVEGGCRRIYLEPAVAISERKITQCGDGGADALLEMLTEALEICQKGGADLIWKWPRITGEVFLAMAVPLLKTVAGLGISGVMVEGTGAADIVRQELPEIPIYGSVGLNVFNHMTVSALSGTFCSLTISQELSEKEISACIALSPDKPALEYIVQGLAELMVTEDCPLYSLKHCGACARGRHLLRDDDGRFFPVVPDGECKTHILNSAETCLIDALPSLIRMGIGSVAIDARHRDEGYAEEISRIYSMALRNALSGEVPADLIKQAKDLSYGGITAGHFRRGLKR